MGQNPANYQAEPKPAYVRVPGSSRPRGTRMGVINKGKHLTERPPPEQVRLHGNDLEFLDGSATHLALTAQPAIAQAPWVTHISIPATELTYGNAQEEWSSRRRLWIHYFYTWNGPPDRTLELIYKIMS